MKSVSLFGSLLLSYHQAAAQSNPRIADLRGFTNVSDPYYGQSPPVYPTRKAFPGCIDGYALTVTQLWAMAVLTRYGRMPMPELAILCRR
jgi:hypothetical protein